MVNLAALQAQMKLAILTGHKLQEDRVRGLFDDIVAGDLSARQRMQIHSNNYKESLTDAVSGQFPVVKAFVGEQFLRACAREYALANPPQEAALSTFGKGFPVFLAQFEHAATVPYMADLAYLEWLVADIQNRKPEQLMAEKDILEAFNNNRVRLARHVEIISSDYPIVNLWMVGTGQIPPEAVTLDADGQSVLVAQINSGVEILPLDADKLRVLSKIQNNNGQTTDYKGAANVADLSDIAAMKIMAEWPIFARQ